MSRTENPKKNMFDRPGKYRICVHGVLSEKWSERLGGMHITTTIKGDQGSITTLVGQIRDQAELAGVLNTLYTLQMPLLSVESIDSAQRNPDVSS